MSFRSYTQEVVEIAARRRTRGVSVIAITDSPLSPLEPRAPRLRSCSATTGRGRSARWSRRSPGADARAARPAASSPPSARRRRAGAAAGARNGGRGDGGDRPASRPRGEGARARRLRPRRLPCAAAAFDVLCMGRAAVDLYGEQIGARLEDVTTFARYLGGSPANTAVGCARLGLSRRCSRASATSRTAASCARRSRAKASTSPTSRPTRRGSPRSCSSASAPRTTSRCSSTATAAPTWGSAPAHVDPAFVAQCGALLLSGTHLSQDGTRAAIDAAIVAARAAGTRIVLDIDYRPVLWGLRRLGDGEHALHRGRRTSARSAGASAALRPRGRHRGGDPDRRRLARPRRRAAPDPRDRRAATIVMKRGADGCIAVRARRAGRSRSAGLSDRGLQRPRRRRRLHGGLPARLAARRCRRPTARAAPTPAARWSCRATAARRRWPRARSSSTSCSTARRIGALREDAGLERLHRATTRRACTRGDRRAGLRPPLAVRGHGRPRVPHRRGSASRASSSWSRRRRCARAGGAERCAAA